MASDLERRFNRLRDPKQSVLSLAAKIGDWSTIYEVLYSRPDLVNFIPENRSHGLLHYAVLSENENAIIKILSIQGCDPNLEDRDGMKANELTDNEHLNEIIEAAQGGRTVESANKDNQACIETFEPLQVNEEQSLSKTTDDLQLKETIETAQTNDQIVTSNPNQERNGNLAEELEANANTNNSNIKNMDGVSANQLTDDLHSIEVTEAPKEILLFEEPNQGYQVIRESVDEYQGSDVDTTDINTTIREEQLTGEVHVKENIETDEGACPNQGYPAVRESFEELQETNTHETDLNLNDTKGANELTDDLHSKESIESSEEVRPKKIPIKKYQMIRETFEELQNRDEAKINELSLALENFQLVEVAKIIDTNQHLVNVVPPELGLGPLHQAAIMGDVDIVNKLLYYPASNPDIETTAAQHNTHGPGKTAVELTTSEEVRKAINWKKQQLTQEYYTCPTYVDITDSNNILMEYAAPTIEAHKGLLCSDRFDSENFNVFPKMVEDVFFYTHYSSKWEQAREITCRELNSFDSSLAKQIMNNVQKSRDSFYHKLINIYISNKTVVNLNLNRELRNQAAKDNEQLTKFRSYTAILNAILFVWDQLEPYTKVTYRGMNLDKSELNDYSVGTEFAWLNFVSSSSDRKVAQRFGKNKDKLKSLFIFDNKRQCKWSPKSIEKISNHEREKEYLYPCGAQFRVTKVETVGEFTHIYLELICVVDPTPLRSLFDETVARTEENIETVKEESKQFDKDLSQLKDIIKTANGKNVELENNENTETNKGEIIAMIEKLNKTLENWKPRMNSLLEETRENILLLEYGLTTELSISSPKIMKRIFFQDKGKDKQRLIQQLKDKVVAVNKLVRNAATSFSDASDLAKQNGLI